MMMFTGTTLRKACVLLALLLLPLTAQARKAKSFKLEFYNNTVDKNYSVIRAADRPGLDPKTFVCELVNVFDPDQRHEIQKFDFSVKTKTGKENFTGVDEAAFLEIVKGLKRASPDGPVAVVTVTKVYYQDHAKSEKTMTGDRYDYAEITIR